MPLIGRPEPRYAGSRNFNALERAIDAEDVARQSLFEKRRAGKRNYRRLVLAGLNHAFDERARGRLLLRQGAFLRNAHVDQERNRQRAICLALKSKNLLRHAIFRHPQVLFPQRGDEGFLFVGGGEEQVGEIGFDAYDFVVLIGRRLRGNARRAGARNKEAESATMTSTAISLLRVT